MDNMNPGLFGSYGPRRQKTFGRRGLSHKADTTGPARPFGKRNNGPAPSNSLQQERLQALYAELILLFADAAFPDGAVPFAWDDATQTIVVGTQARISCDRQSGAFIFSDQTPRARAVLTSPHSQRIVDGVISHLSGMRHPDMPSMTLGVIEKCVGHRVADVERALILATLRSFNGNRTHAARQLGISLRTLRNKLNGYWRTVLDEAGGPSSAIERPPQLDRPA